MAIGKRLNRVDERRHFAVLTSVLSVITLILNGLSLYLRQLPPPQFSNTAIAGVYSITIALVHFSALILLILVAVIVGAFLVKYSMPMLRNL